MFYMFRLFNILYDLLLYVYAVLFLIGNMLYTDERHVEFDKKKFFELLMCYYASNITSNFLVFNGTQKIVFINYFSNLSPLYKYNIFVLHPVRSMYLALQCYTHLHTDLLTLHTYKIESLLGKYPLFLDKYISRKT